MRANLSALVILVLTATTAQAQNAPLSRAYIYGAGSSAKAPFYAIMQGNLKILDYYGGAIDGNVGPATVAAIKQFQRDQGLPASGALNAATTRKAKQRVAAYYRAQLGFDFNGQWAPKGKCGSRKQRFRVQQSAWFKPSGSRTRLPTLDFARVKSKLVEPRLSDTWPPLKSDGKRPYVERQRPPLPLAKPKQPELPATLTAAELTQLEDNWPKVDLVNRAAVPKPDFTQKLERTPGQVEREYYQRCS